MRKVPSLILSCARSRGPFTLLPYNIVPPPQDIAGVRTIDQTGYFYYVTLYPEGPHCLSSRGRLMINPKTWLVPTEKIPPPADASRQGELIMDSPGPSFVEPNPAPDPPLPPDPSPFPGPPLPEPAPTPAPPQPPNPSPFPGPPITIDRSTHL